jgi:hypothetical protein
MKNNFASDRVEIKIIADLQLTDLTCDGQKGLLGMKLGLESRRKGAELLNDSCLLFWFYLSCFFELTILLLLENEITERS